MESNKEQVSSKSLDGAQSPWQRGISQQIEEEAKPIQLEEIYVDEEDEQHQPHLRTSERKTNKVKS